MFKSRLKDIHGSNIIFAGPHRSFSMGNGQTDIIPTQSILFLGNPGNLEGQENEEDDNPCQSQIHYSRPAYKESGLTMHLHALDEQDFIDAGCEVPDQLEDLVDKGDPGVFSNLMRTVNHFCSLLFK